MPPVRRLKKVLPHHEKINLLDMLKGGKRCAEVARYYDLNESTVRYIKKKETEIRRTHKGLLEMMEPVQCELSEPNVVGGRQPTCNLSQRRLRSFKSSKCSTADLQPQVSIERLKRKTQSNLACMSSATSDRDEAEVEVVVEDEEEDNEVENEEKTQGHSVEKQSKVNGKDLPTKGEKPHKCQLCDFRCRDESYLSKHMLTHSEDRKFICEECGYITKWKHYLNIHMRKHAGDLRYECDQCPYRCHRLDQLNSHKLRHQAKSLICEICAYACKRKCELRNHMLVRHLAEGKQASVHQCKYCTYTTCFKQALQNHENCKHTRLKQYCCALCPYSSFSSISLFQHKRKAHGYVPGDKAWLEDYAAKERARYSSSILDDSLIHNEISVLSTEEPIPTEQPNPRAPVDHDTIKAADICSEAVPLLDADVRKEGTSEEVSHSPPPATSPEYCTLILTTLTPECETFILPNKEPSSHVTSANSKSTEERGALCLSPNSAEDETAVQCEDGKSPYESDNETPESPPEKNLILEKDCPLNSSRKENKALVLDGRAWMLALPAQDIYHCDQCSYVTKKEKTLERHRRSFCRGRPKYHKCQTCGAQFKQRRGLDGHLAKKCPQTFIAKIATQIEEGSIPSSDTSEKVVHQKRISSEVDDPDGSVQSTSTSIDSQHSSSQHEDILVHRNVIPRKFPHISRCQKGKKCSQIVSMSIKDKPIEKGSGKSSSSVLEGGMANALAIQKEPNVVQGSTCAVKPKYLHLKSSVEQQGHKVRKQTGASCPLTCRYCSFTTTRRYRLEEHQSLHTGTGRHACDICDKSFGAATKLRQHKVRVHDRQPSLPCSFCDYSGYTADDVRRHTRRCHMGDSRHDCTDCEARFTSEAALRNHRVRAHRQQARFACEQCAYACSSEATLRNHQRSKHQESFEAEKNFQTDLRIHFAHHCQLCPFAGKTRQLLVQHLLDEHEDGLLSDKPLRCGSCAFACRHTLVLEQHLRSHGGKRMYKCVDCKYSTGNKQKITWHVRIHTGEKPYSCEHCSYTCVDPSRLKLHMRVHRDEKKYLCPDCGYKCKWATQLKYHMTKHTGEKPYVCDQCDYRTNRADALRAHRTTRHCDVRAYVCEKCGKAFKTSFILKTHQRQHGDQQSYACGVCHKAFRWPAGLRHHFLTHTEQLPFGCHHCSYRAKQKFQVVKHLQKHHPGMPIEQGVVRDLDTGGLTLKEAMQGTLNNTGTEEERDQETTRSRQTVS